MKRSLFEVAILEGLGMMLGDFKVPEEICQRAGGSPEGLWVSLLCLGAAADVQNKQIPSAVSLGLLAAGLLVLPEKGLLWFRLAGLVPGLLLLAWHLWSGGKGLGGGDVKLILAAGLFLGAERLLWGLLTCFLGAALYGLGRRKKEEVILGPWLALGLGLAGLFTQG